MTRRVGEGAAVATRMVHPDSGRLAEDLRRLLAADGIRPWRGLGYRAARIGWAGRADIGNGAGALARGGRWNPPGRFPVVYASSTPELALAESLAHYRRYAVPEHAGMPLLIRALDLRLVAVLDLLDPRVLRTLGLETDDLRRARWWDDEQRRAADSRPGGETITEAIGRTAHAAGLEGLLAPTATETGGFTIAVFPDRLRPGSRVEIDALVGPAGPADPHDGEGRSGIGRK